MRSAGLHYFRRCLSLGANLIRGRAIHCNLQVTYRCNFQCQICDFWKPDVDKTHELSLDDIRHIGRELARMGTLIVSLAGGEPLMREDLELIIRILNEAGHFPILITNGWYVDESRARSLQQAGLQEISVSLDYADPARHDQQRGAPGSWDRAVKALELLKRYRPSPRHRVHMISVLMDDNLEDIERLIQLSRQLGVTYMVNLYSWNRGTKSRRLPLTGVTRHLLDLKRRYPEFISLTSYLERFDEAIDCGGIGNCRTGRLLLNIDNHGNVARCTETLDEPVGNILRQAMPELYKNLLDVQENSTCAQCWTSCRGFAESMHQPPRWRQLREFYTSVRPQP